MAKRDRVTAFLGKDTTFDGRMAFHGAIRIDGHFKGEIVADGTLIIGEGGVLEAAIQASHIVISGEVRGDILARERIDIHRSGSVLGNIRTPTLVLEEGGVFDGNCLMDAAITKKDDEPAVPEPDDDGVDPAS